MSKVILLEQSMDDVNTEPMETYLGIKHEVQLYSAVSQIQQD